MSQQDLILGLKYAQKHGLTHREIELLLYFLNKKYTAEQLSSEMNKNVTTVYHVIQRLKLKNLISITDKDEKGTNIYEFNESSMSNR